MRYLLSENRTARSPPKFPDKPMLTSEECLICNRIGTEQFYRELRELGYSPEITKTILQEFAKMYFKYPTLFAGRTRNIIKASFTRFASLTFANQIFNRDDPNVDETIKQCYGKYNIPGVERGPLNMNDYPSWQILTWKFNVSLKGSQLLTDKIWKAIQHK